MINNNHHYDNRESTRSASNNNSGYTTPIRKINQEEQLTTTPSSSASSSPSPSSSSSTTTTSSSSASNPPSSSLPSSISSRLDVLSHTSGFDIPSLSSPSSSLAHRAQIGLISKSDTWHACQLQVLCHLTNDTGCLKLFTILSRIPEWTEEIASKDVTSRLSSIVGIDAGIWSKFDPYPPSELETFQERYDPSGKRCLLASTEQTFIVFLKCNRIDLMYELAHRIIRATRPIHRSHAIYTGFRQGEDDGDDIVDGGVGDGVGDDNSFNPSRLGSPTTCFDGSLTTLQFVALIDGMTFHDGRMHHGPMEDLVWHQGGSYCFFTRFRHEEEEEDDHSFEDEKKNNTNANTNNSHPMSGTSTPSYRSRASSTATTATTGGTPNVHRRRTSSNLSMSREFGRHIAQATCPLTPLRNVRIDTHSNNNSSSPSPSPSSSSHSPPATTTPTSSSTHLLIDPSHPSNMPMLRHAYPYQSPTERGYLFSCFHRSLKRIHEVLDRMTLTTNIQQRMFQHTLGIEGGYLYIPSREELKRLTSTTGHYRTNINNKSTTPTTVTMTPNRTMRSGTNGERTSQQDWRNAHPITVQTSIGSATTTPRKQSSSVSYSSASGVIPPSTPTSRSGSFSSAQRPPLSGAGGVVPISSPSGSPSASWSSSSASSYRSSVHTPLATPPATPTNRRPVDPTTPTVTRTPTIGVAANPFKPMTPFVSTANMRNTNTNMKK